MENAFGTQYSSRLLDLLQDGTAVSSLASRFAEGDLRSQFHRRTAVRVIDEAWLDAIEGTLPALDRVMRKPTRFIKESERVLSIGQSKNITARSIRDLAMHSDYMEPAGQNGELLPTKILNVFRDETTETYENRFINTLVDKLFLFVDKRCRLMRDAGDDEKSASLDVATAFSHGDLVGNIRLSMEIYATPTEKDAKGSELAGIGLFSRVEKLRSVLIAYRSGEFCKMMGQSFVRPPILRTNALLKNPDYRECLALYEFLEGYDKIGYDTLIEEKTEAADSELVSEVLQAAACQLLLFRSRVEGTASAVGEFRQNTPRFVPRERDEDRQEDVFDLRDSVYRKALSVIHLDGKEDSSMTAEEESVCDAIAIALRVSEMQENVKQLRETFSAESGRVTYKKSFLAKLIQSGAPMQDYYSELKNLLLSYKGVRARMTEAGESFNKGRSRLAYLTVRGKSIYLYLALTPSDYDVKKYRTAEVAKSTRFADVPMFIKLGSNRALRNAKELLEILMQKLALLQGTLKNIDYHMPFETTEALIERGLIKEITYKPSDETESDDGQNAHEEIDAGVKEPTADVSVEEAEEDDLTKDVEHDIDQPKSASHSEEETAASAAEESDKDAQIDASDSASPRWGASEADRQMGREIVDSAALGAHKEPLPRMEEASFEETREPSNREVSYGVSPTFSGEGILSSASGGVSGTQVQSAQASESPQLNGGVAVIYAAKEEDTTADIVDDRKPMEKENPADSIPFTLEISDDFDITQYYSREEMERVVRFIAENTASSAFDRIGGEVLLCYRILMRFRPSKRKKYHKLLIDDDLHTVIKAKDTLLHDYLHLLKK